MHAFPVTLPWVGRAKAHAASSFTGMLRAATLTAAGATAVSAGVGGVVAGPSGAVGAIAGGVTVTVVLALGVAGLRTLLSGPDSMAIAVALGVYGVQLSVLFSAFLWVRRLGVVDVLPFGLTALAVTLAWQVGLIAGLLTSRQLVYDGQGDRP